MNGARDLHAAALRLAIQLSEDEATRAVLVVQAPRVTRARLESEWSKVERTLHPDIARRLSLVALGVDGEVGIPAGDPTVAQLLEAARSLVEPERAEIARPVGGWDPKRFEVWKVLFNAWLRKEPPLAIGDVARRAGASHPTVLSTLDRLESQHELERTSSRRAFLTGMPRRSLAELAVLAPGLRQTVHLIDASGRDPAPEDLLARFLRRAPEWVQVGGVAAARHYMPAFNLNGFPRLDVTVDARRFQIGWWREVDPALVLTGPDTPSPAVVVHLTSSPGEGDRYASPSETVLDLLALKLDGQADDLIRSMRGA